MAWPTATEVHTTTGVTVTGSAVTTAISVIETVTGRDLSDPTLYSEKDQRHLGLAIAWQAAYQTKNPSALSDIVADSKSVADVSLSGIGGKAGSAGSFLAPLARAALRKVSWKRMRTVEVGRLADKVPHTIEDDLADRNYQWKPTF